MAARLSALCTSHPLHLGRFLLSRLQGHTAAGSITSIKKSSDFIGNRTHDLQACSIVPRPTTLRRTESAFNIFINLFHLVLCGKLFSALVSTVILGSESRGTLDHNLLFQTLGIVSLTSRYVQISISSTLSNAISAISAWTAALLHSTEYYCSSFVIFLYDFHFLCGVSEVFEM
jgi:hypothetical protein